MELLISVVIVVYNNKDKIEKAILSVLSQTYRNVELVVIDGGSTDGTIQIIKKYTSQIGCFVSEADNGIYDAMNKGLRLSKGEWVYFLGSDDFLYNDSILSVVAQLASTKEYDVIYGSVYHEDFKRVYDREFNAEKICRDGICHQSIFYRKQILLDYGGYRTDMKAYAHIYLDKILFVNPNIRWKYVDEIISSYAGAGFSSAHFDQVYWNEAEELLNKCFENKLSKRVIYESLQPMVDYQFNAKSFILSFKIAYHTKSLYSIKRWFRHPAGIARLTIKKVLPK